MAEIMAGVLVGTGFSEVICFSRLYPSSPSAFSLLHPRPWINPRAIPTNPAQADLPRPSQLYPFVTQGVGFVAWHGGFLPVRTSSPREFSSEQTYDPCSALYGHAKR